MKRTKTIPFLILMLLTFISLSCDNSNGPGKINLEITSVSPDSGSIHTKVTITGSGFVPDPSDNSVIFNNTPAQVSSVSENEITTRVPAGAQSGPIQIKVGDKTVTGPSFMISKEGQEALAVNSLEPKEGDIGTEVMIYGCGFKTEKSKNTVKFNGTLAEVSKVQSKRIDSHKSKEDSLLGQKT